MTAIEKLIDVAKAEEGYLEKSLSAYENNPNIVWDKVKGAGYENVTKYWEEVRKSFQWDNQPWCQCYVYWCFMKCYGADLAQRMLYLTPDLWTIGESWKNFYTPNWSDNFKANGASVQSSQAKVGDIVYFKNAKRVHHTGIVIDVERYSDGTGKLTTIEGNTSSESGVVSNGGAVRIKKYAMTRSGIDSVAWYGRPNYELAEDDDPTDETTDVTLKVLERGVTPKKTREIYTFQILMEYYGYYGMTVDGSYGNGSETACKRFQKDCGLPQTGICDEATWTALLTK